MDEAPPVSTVVKVFFAVPGEDNEVGPAIEAIRYYSNHLFDCSGAIPFDIANSCNMADVKVSRSTGGVERVRVVLVIEVATQTVCHHAFGERKPTVALLIEEPQVKIDTNLRGTAKRTKGILE